MKWIIALLKWVAREHRVIPDRVYPEQPYLSRWYLIGGPSHKWFTVCLHEFHCSDPTDLHDHPWPYATVILTGGYYEQTPEGFDWRKPGTILCRKAQSLHRIVLDLHKLPVYTLFFMGPRWREWGFRKLGKWIDHNTYLDAIAKKA